MSSVATTAYSSRGSLRQRLISAALALAVALVVVLGLILSGVLPQIFVPIGTRALSTFNVAAGGQTVSPRPKPQAKAAAKQASKPPSRTMPPPIVKMAIHPPTGMIILSKDDFAATDIGKIRGNADSGAEGKGTQSADSGSASGPGTGPGGKTLYAAEWYREPTEAEMGTYIPRNGREGFGEIACRTIERYHVDDCRVIAETPGTGFGHAVQNAAWQFLVRPPRVNGQPMIGSWVRIRYDLIRGFVK